MTILMLNGSPHREGNTFLALTEIAKTLADCGAESEIVWLGAGPVRDCCACGACRELGGRCAFGDDAVNEIIEKAETSDGFVFGTPVYYAHPSGTILSALDRCFFAGGKAFAFKPGAAVAIARRAGTVASIDVLNKYFTINRMPVVSSTYWNDVFGRSPGEVAKDYEGMQTMRNLARNMICAVNAYSAVEKPEAEKASFTCFIR